MDDPKNLPWESKHVAFPAQLEDALNCIQPYACTWQSDTLCVSHPVANKLAAPLLASTASSNPCQLSELCMRGQRLS